MSTTRFYTTRRQSIVNALVEVIKQIDGTGEFHTNLDLQVSPRLKFWDEIKQFPAVHLNAGSETRIYQGGGFKERYLTITVRCYVKDENDSVTKLDELLEDVETMIEDNSYLIYFDKRGKQQRAQQITVAQIDTDEGVLGALGVGEITIEVQY